MTTNGVSIPPERVRAAREVAAVLVPSRRVALTTHVNADGDGVGSEVALWHLLTRRGLEAVIANPTPIPKRFHFLLPNGADRSERAVREIAAADVVLVLDISDLSRLGDLARTIKDSHAVACIDHHVSRGGAEGRVRLRAAWLGTLVVEPESVLAWVTVPRAALQRHGATADDLDGIVEYPRSIAGVRLALLFRQIANGRVKVSFRSLGTVDVAELAHRFGGGGHSKAAGASLEGSIAEAQEKVLAAAREYLGQNPSSTPTRTVRLGP